MIRNSPKRKQTIGFKWVLKRYKLEFKWVLKMYKLDHLADKYKARHIGVSIGRVSVE